MKKVILILLAAIMMVPALAQNDFPRYGFWSNWSVGAAPMFSKDFTNTWTLGKGTNVGADLRFVKQLNYKWQFRIIADVPGFITADTMSFDRYGKGMIGFAWYPWAKHFYMFCDGGGAVLRDDYSYAALAADAGLGLNFNFCKHSTIFGEVGLDCVADITKEMTYNNVFAKIGYAYRFGLTKTDQEIDAQRLAVAGIVAELTAERDGLNKTNDSLVGHERSLAEYISKLEQHDSTMHVEIYRLTSENDSLKRVIRNIDDNKTNFYSMPFSVMFDVNSYSIKSSEHSKIKAVAAMMKSDTTATYTIGGFCDNSGSDAYNMKLAQKRADAVKNALVKLGVKKDQLTTKSYGKGSPFCDAKYDVNRRVSFFKD